MPLDTSAAIALADGREWSLVPLAIALTLSFLLIAAGTLLLAALARRWQGLGGG